MTTGRINQVAFLRDVGTAWPSTCRVSGEEVTTVHERRPRLGTKCVATEGQGPGPRTRKTFRIRKHDRAPMDRCGRTVLRGHARDTGHD